MPLSWEYATVCDRLGQETTVFFELRNSLDRVVAGHYFCTASTPTISTISTGVLGCRSRVRLLSVLADTWAVSEQSLPYAKQGP